MAYQAITSKRLEHNQGHAVVVSKPRNNLLVSRHSNLERPSLTKYCKVSATLGLSVLLNSIYKRTQRLQTLSQMTLSNHTPENAGDIKQIMLWLRNGVANFYSRRAVSYLHRETINNELHLHLTVRYTTNVHYQQRINHACDFFFQEG